MATDASDGTTVAEDGTTVAEDGTDGASDPGDGDPSTPSGSTGSAPGRPDGASPPGPGGLPILGNVHQLASGPLAFYEGLAREYPGDVVNYRILGDQGYLLTHPADVETVLVERDDDFVKGAVFEETIGDVVENGMVVLEGEQWQRHRQALQPAFTMDRIRSYGDAMSDFAAREAETWTAGEPLRIDDAMRTYTLDVIARTLFAIDVDGDRRETLASAARAMTERFDMSSVSAFLPIWVPTRANRRCKRALSEFRGVVDEIVAERRAARPTGGRPRNERAGATGGSDTRAADETPDDLLSLMLGATEGEDAAMTDEELHDELVTFLFAGHETTSLALSYAWFLLANNPESQERLHEEVDALDGDPGVADLGDLRITDRVLSETLRLYPPGPVTFREPVRDVDVGGYTIPEGSAVVLCQWLCQRDERWWDQPEAFRPERWTEEDPDRPEYAYFPFGGGPRHCIGMRFARMEAKLALATIARRWSFDPVTEPPLDISVQVTLQPDDGITVVPRQR